VDIRAIAKHYLLKSTSFKKPFGNNSPPGVLDRNKPGIKRHYTEAFCMRKEIYNGILRLVNEKNQEQTSKINATMNDMIAVNNKRTLCLTIKNYPKAYGLSSHVHHTISKMDHGVRERFEIRGPLGTGLELETNGTYVVFAAGTGILVFIDLIAHLILRLVANNGEINVFND